jgi:hypothetical protein
MYGMNGKQLRIIAAAEMTRRNGQVFTGGVSIPLRPELRLGYPVYIEHMDSFYYVTGITHNITFGSSATTDLSLQYKRERVFEDKNSPSYLSGVSHGDVLKGCVMRNQIALISKVKDIAKKAKNNEPLSDYEKLIFGVGNDNGPISDAKLEEMSNDLEKHILQDSNHFRGGPGDPIGYWKIDRAVPSMIADTMQNADTPDATPNNELVIITDTTMPYTDKMGYKHIGAFPYGANLSIVPGKGLFNMMDPVQVADKATMDQVNEGGAIKTDTIGEAAGAPAAPEDPKKAADDFYEKMKDRVDYTPSFYSAPSSSTSVDMAVGAQVDDGHKKIDRPQESIVQAR